jgi:nitrate/nitrite transporter NarK
MLINTVFPGVDAFQFAFIGPLLAAFVRPVGGWLADRLRAAIAAFGGFFIPMAYDASIEWTGSPQGALFFFSLFYLSCVLVTWRWYSRKEAEVAC